MRIISSTILTKENIFIEQFNEKIQEILVELRTIQIVAVAQF